MKEIGSVWSDTGLEYTTSNTGALCGSERGRSVSVRLLSSCPVSTRGSSHLAGPHLLETNKFSSKKIRRHPS